MKPPVFEGETDPLQAEGWLLQIEKILDVINCIEEQKSVFLIFHVSKRGRALVATVKDGVKNSGEWIT